jgi:hypothetical protein
VVVTRSIPFAIEQAQPEAVDPLKKTSKKSDGISDDALASNALLQLSKLSDQDVFDQLDKLLKDTHDK